MDAARLCRPRRLAALELPSAFQPCVKHGNSVIDAVRPWPELTVLPMFSPQSLRTEGAATFAAELAFPDASRLGFERDELFPLAGLNPEDADRYLRVSRAVDRLRWLQADIARRYLDGDLEFARAAAALEEEALMPSAVATLKFFNEFRTDISEGDKVLVAGAFVQSRDIFDQRARE